MVICWHEDQKEANSKPANPIIQTLPFHRANGQMSSRTDEPYKSQYNKSNAARSMYTGRSRRQLYDNSAPNFISQVHLICWNRIFNATPQSTGQCSGLSCQRFAVLISWYRILHFCTTPPRQCAHCSAVSQDTDYYTQLVRRSGSMGG